MPKRVSTLKHMLRRMLPRLRERGSALRTFSETMGFVYFGDVDQHKDEYDSIRGFTASLSHLDAHYSVGTFEGYDFRITDRFDAYKGTGNSTHEQLWCILEVSLHSLRAPHTFLIPTGSEGGEYTKVFASHPHVQPLNTMLMQTHSRELHGRFQILARTVDAPLVEQLLPSPIIVGIGARFWPHGIELKDDKLYVYITQHRLNKAVLESTLASTLWLAEMLDEVAEN